MTKGEIYSGDIVGLLIDGVGFLATPSVDEPIPEKSEAISHTRIIRGDETIEPDSQRCLFKIESDVQQVILCCYYCVSCIVSFQSIINQH